MDTKQWYIVTALLILGVLGYQWYLQKYVYPKHPNWDIVAQRNAQTQPAPPAESPAGETGSNLAESVITTNPSGAAATRSAGAFHAIQAVHPAPELDMGSGLYKDRTFALDLKINPIGASLNSATINHYKAIDATVKDVKDLYKYQEPYPGHDSSRVLATTHATINGQGVDLNVPWKLESDPASHDEIRLGVDIADSSDKPVVHLDKTFRMERVPTKNFDNTSGGYQVLVEMRAVDLGRKPVTVQLDFDGPTMPRREMERGDDRQLVAGYDKGNNEVYLGRTSLSDFKPASNARSLSVNDKGYKLLWSGMTSVYFSAIIQPRVPAQLQSVTAEALNPQAQIEDRLLAMNYTTAPLALAPGQGIDVPLTVFLGPKDRDLLNGDYYGVFPREYDDLLSSSTSFCGVCAFPWLVSGLIDLLAFLHIFLRDWGLSIIALVIIVRAILHPITKSSQVSMLKMQKMGPEMERLKKKYGDNKEEFAKAQMQMYKQMGATPILGCLPMVLQMPIWIALYTALQNEIRLRQAPFLWGLTWIHDLSRPDRLISWDRHPVVIPIIGYHLTALNILPLLMAVMMYLQQKFTPQPPTMTPEQEQQRKMMSWMSVLFGLFLYSYPSGLSLYILTSSTIGIFESKRIREHIKKVQAREEAGPVIVDAEPARGNRRGKGEDGRETSSLATAGPRTPRGPLSWWARMQQRVEDLQREAERKSRKRS